VETSGGALMSVLLLLIPVSIGMAALFVGVCLAAIRGGQFDDLESPRWRVLFDNKPEDHK
jgi:cbb3-type cytochrome oxidase maturation protein